MKDLNKKNLLTLANKIYNPNTGKYKKLCKGKIQNKSGLQCGLGIIYAEFIGDSRGMLTNIALYRIMNKGISYSDLTDLVSLNDRADRYFKRAKAVANQIKLIATHLE